MTYIKLKLQKENLKEVLDNIHHTTFEVQTTDTKTIVLTLNGVLNKCYSSLIELPNFRSIQVVDIQV